MFVETTQFAVIEDVLVSELPDGEAVLLHMRTQRYYSLNETGLFLWQRLREGHSLGALCNALVQHFAISAAQAEAAVTDLVTDLHAAQLVKPQP